MESKLTLQLLRLRIAGRNLFAVLADTFVRRWPLTPAARRDLLDDLYRYAVETSCLEDDLEDAQRHEEGER